MIAGKSPAKGERFETMSQTILVAIAGVFLFLYLMRRRSRLKKEN
jgi:hypothetical protein